MPIVGLSPTWQVKTGRIGSLVTCDVSWNGKTVLWNNTVVKKAWSVEPAYEPLQLPKDSQSQTLLVANNDTPYPFPKMPVPGIITRGRMYINSNTMTKEFEVWLGRDGPTVLDASAIPVEEKLLFRVLARSEPEYNTTISFPPSSSDIDDVSIPLFGGHGYGYVFKTADGVKPGGTLIWSMALTINFGGGGS